jgi:hypothetical protein
VWFNVSAIPFEVLKLSVLKSDSGIEKIYKQLIPGKVL